mmetsp:Transcript_17039/g.36728  ORF Transcript_17039/g.36728 Transcript_17039/m.36728 type:complete len:233 (-) Transcript_17039:172-870(-)
MNALLINLTESWVSRSQNDVSSSSSLVKSKNLVTEWETKEMQPLESNTTIKSGIERSICSFRRNSTFSSLRSSMNIFLRLRDKCAERRLAARLASFLPSHLVIISWIGGCAAVNSANAADADRTRRLGFDALGDDCLLVKPPLPLTLSVALAVSFAGLLSGKDGTALAGGGGMARVEGDNIICVLLAGCKAGDRGEIDGEVNCDKVAAPGSTWPPAAMLANAAGDSAAARPG